MKIKIYPKLNKLELYAVNNEVSQLGVGTGGKKELQIASFSNPVLLIDNAKIGKLPSAKRDAVMKLYEFPDRFVEYDGVEVFWSPILYPKVWAPSIDTILFAEAIRKELVIKKRLKKIDNFLEIGMGSGYLSKYILVKKRDLGQEMKSAHLADINKDAVKCAIDNIEPIRGNTLMYYTHTQQNAHLNIDKQYDLVIVNPPYLPRPGVRRNNPYEGLLLYREVLKNAKKMMHKDSLIMIIFSSVSKDIVKPELDKIFKLHKVVSLKVPLKIPIVTAALSKKSKQWINYLKKKKSLDEDKKEISGHRYWQEIEVVIGKLK